MSWSEGEFLDPSWVEKEEDVVFLQQSFWQPVALLIGSSQLLLVSSWFSCKWLLAQVWRTNQIQSLPWRAWPQGNCWVLALGSVQHLLLCGRGIPFNPHSPSVRQRLLFLWVPVLIPPPKKGNNISPQTFKNAVEFNEVNPTALGDMKKHRAWYKSIITRSVNCRKKKKKTQQSCF